MSRELVSFADLTLGYDRHPAVHHLSGALEAGSLTAIVGANGSGKSTLLKAIAGILRPMEGSIRVSPGATTAYLPQESEIDRGFPATVSDLVSLGLWRKRGLLGRITGADRASVAAAVEAVGLAGFEKRPLDTLSGGQMQRTLFARVILQDARLILLDEPFNAIDAKTVRDLLAIIRGWHGEGRTVVAVLHDMELVRQHFPKTLLLARRPLAWGDTNDVLTTENLRHAREFDEAWHEDAPWCGDDHPKAHGHDHHDHNGHDHSHAVPDRQSIVRQDSDRPAA